MEPGDATGWQEDERRTVGGTLQHLREVYTIYYLPDMPLAELEDFGHAINAILLTDGLVNVYGEDLLAPENQNSVPYHPDAWRRANRIRAGLGVAGIHVRTDLPSVRSEHELTLRAPAEAATRMCALIAVGELANWWQHRELNLVEEIFAKLSDACLALTSAEQNLMEIIERGDRSERARDAMVQLGWSLHAAAALACVLGQCTSQRISVVSRNPTQLTWLSLEKYVKTHR